MAGLTDLMDYRAPFVGRQQRDVYSPSTGTRQTQERNIVGGGARVVGFGGRD